MAGKTTPPRDSDDSFLSPHDLDLDPIRLGLTGPDRADVGIGPTELGVGFEQEAHPADARAIDDSARARYERLLKHRGENVVVGVEHGVCGGCHMKLPTQVLVSCQAEQGIVTCINCGRILYYTRDMDLVGAE